MENTVISKAPYNAPLCAAIKPTQFKSGDEEGKTNTCLKEMKKMNKYFMSLGENISTSIKMNKTSKKKIPIHIIFTNNSLIETKQWKNKVANFGVNTMAILSSDDIKTKREISSLIQDGDEEGRKVNYIMCCAHSVRLEDIKWLIKTYHKDNRDYVFDIYFDEFDKLQIFVDFINIVKRYENVYNLTAISATPYKEWFKLLHKCGYDYVSCVTDIEDSSEYRRIKDHELIYTDTLSTFISPVAHFNHIINNPGTVSYEDEEFSHKLPDIKSLSGKIIFVPGEYYISTHDEIKDIAIENNWNCLVLNGKHKTVYFADGKFVTISSYRKSYPDKFNEYDGIMNIVREMYKDPILKLKEKNLIITGFNCVERGVTFNTPDFQFYAAIFAPYHYKEGSSQKESIIQLAGRTTGWDKFVPTMKILAPKYLIDEVSKSQDALIEFLKLKPDFISYADMISDGNAIPIYINISEFNLIQLEGTKGNSKKLEIIKKGIERGEIQFSNSNRDYPTKLRFDTGFNNYTLKTIRSCTEDTNYENYRFDKYIESYDTGHGYGQSNKEGEFSIDINYKDHIKNGVKILRGIGFISYAWKDIV